MLSPFLLVRHGAARTDEITFQLGDMAEQERLPLTACIERAHRVHTCAERACAAAFFLTAIGNERSPGCACSRCARFHAFASNAVPEKLSEQNRHPANVGT